ncbi:unnamed protein product [Protopolystoma xenopodis]|uniref:Uncharacterized protein n=1 Tax=Protopolystoma xenopodis TaxID=117903 RepID=A0A448XPI6_9PLAT|nr:unnamed protein product [Protopolystoma xenopodis]
MVECNGKIPVCLSYNLGPIPIEGADETQASCSCASVTLFLLQIGLLSLDQPKPECTLFRTGNGSRFMWPTGAGVSGVHEFMDVYGTQRRLETQLSRDRNRD